jgi:hypothetical protein
MSARAPRRPSGALVRRRGRIAAAAAALAALVAPTAAVATTDDRVVRYELEGTVTYVVADPQGDPHAHEGEGVHFHEGAVVRAVADVDGTLVDLSAVQEPVIGASELPADALPQGSDVVVTLEAEPGLDEAALLERAPVLGDEPGATAHDEDGAAHAEEPPAGAHGDPDEHEHADQAPPQELVTSEAVVVAAVAGSEAAYPVTAALAGVHTLVVLPVQWAGAPAAPVADLQRAVAGTEQYWEAQSGGTLDVRASVRTPVAITAPTGCNTQALMDAALAANPGVTISRTSHVAVHYPAIAACPFAGQATINGGHIWLNGSSAANTYVLAHELGHNFGLGHANTLSCATGGGRVPLLADVSQCQMREYGDNSDVMGQGRSLTTPGNLSSGFAHRLGWAGITDVTGAPSGTSTYELAPLSRLSGPRGLLVRASSGSVYVDYRPAAGADAVHEPAWAGVQTRLVTENRTYGYVTSYLLDQQPSQPAFRSPFLPVGGSWTVPSADTTLTTVSTGATARVQVGSAGATGQIQRYVTKVYADLFQRAPDPTGLRDWTTALRNGTPRIAVANSITGSDEYRSRLIAQAYRDYLGRPADPAGAAGWLQGMRTGSTIQEIEAGFIASDEYYLRAGNTDAAWVRQLYRHVLGRDAAASEVQGWTRGLVGGTPRRQVALGFLLSTEHLTTVVDGYYVSLLGRGIDPTGSRSWVSAIQAGARVEAIIGGIVASEEYYAKV